MFWKDRKVLVTGAGGFIGSHLTERLIAEGAVVRAMVRYSSRGGAGWLTRQQREGLCEVAYGDVRDNAFVRQTIRGMDTVFHLASLIAIPYSYRAPASYVDVNIGGTLNVLQACTEHAVRRIVHTSTSEVYGTAKSVPMTESHPLQAQSPYAATKIGADKLAESWFCAFGTPVTILRPFNTFGPRQSARAVIPTIISQLLKGSEVKIGSIEPTRDMNFVANTVDGFLLAAESDRAVGETVHLGSGREVSIGDLAGLCARSVGVNFNLVEESERKRPSASEVERLVADATKAQQILGWRPRLSLEQGIDQTVAWIRDHMDEFTTERFVF